MGEGRNGLLNRAAVRRLIQSIRPGTRVSEEYAAGLEAKVYRTILGHAHRNGGKKAWRADLFLEIPASPRRGAGRHAVGCTGGPRT